MSLLGIVFWVVGARNLVSAAKTARFHGTASETRVSVLTGEASVSETGFYF